MIKIQEQLREMFPHGHKDFVDITLKEMMLHSEKNYDYARGGEALGNFYRVSDVMATRGFKISPAMVAILYAEKQVDAAVQMMLGDYEGGVEGVDSRLGDAHVYYKLARILHKEEAGQPRPGFTKTPREEVVN